MKYILCALGIFLLVNSASAERICVLKKPKVNSVGRINMIRAIRFTTEECTAKQFELTIPAEPVKTTLPAGETITGFYSLGGIATAAGQSFRSEIEFSIPLAAVPTVEVIEIGESTTTNCAGSPASPTAAPGFLCIYEGADGSATFPFVTSSNQLLGSLISRDFSTIFVSGTSASTKYGATILANSVAAGSMFTSGTWAVTAAE